MPEDRLITVAIHTYEHAIHLKNLLESEGVPVVLHNVNLSHPVVSSGVRVRIKENDLPLALRIIENTEIFRVPASLPSQDGRSLFIVPVDFSAHSTEACDIAFHLAYRHKSTILLLYTYLDPYLAGNVQLNDSMSYDSTLADSEMREVLEKESRKLMDNFAAKIRQRIKTSELPPVKFTTEVAEGVPEEVIVECAKARKPEMIVMGTRGAGTKEKELIGSVTAEVLDSCRRPVFTVPESVNLSRIDDISHVLFFGNLEQEDILALDALYRFFSEERLNVTIVPVAAKKSVKGIAEASSRLMDYCTDHYPRFMFKLAAISLHDIITDFDKVRNEQPVDLIALPNKKKNIFARLFNPSLAHKLLFHSDIPMVVIPV